MNTPFLYDSRKLTRRLERVEWKRKNPQFDHPEIIHPVTECDFEDVLIITNELGSLLECIDIANARTDYLGMFKDLQKIRFILTHIYVNEFHYGPYPDGIDIEEVGQYQSLSETMRENVVRNKLLSELPSLWQKVLEEFEVLQKIETERVQFIIPYISKVAPIVNELSKI